MPTETNKLKIKLIQPTDMFADDAFNNVIKDLDNKVVGIAHLTSGAHWEVWTKDTKYAKGDIVRTTTCKSNQYFQCIVGGTSGKDEPKNQGTGAQITDNTATWIINEIGSSDSSNGGAVIFIGEKYYTKGQLAIFNGVLYRSIKDHIAKTTFQEDFANWQKLYSNIRQWADSTFYFSGEIVINDNKLYKCNKNHVSAGTFVSDINSWDSLSSNGIETFKPSTYYNDGAIIVEDNRLYRCISAHTSTTDLISDIQNWELLSNIQDWEKSKNYIQGNIVLYDNTPYKVIKNHVSNDFSLDKDNFELTYSNIRDFNVSSYYKAGSYVLYNNNIYKALKDTTGDISGHLQLQSSASFRDSNNTYTKVIGAGSQGVSLLTEPNGNYINTVIDLGNIYDITRIALSTLLTEYCEPCETIIETSTDGTSYIKANSFAKNYWDNTDSFQLNINEKARYIKIVFKSVYKRGGNGFTFKNVSIYTANTDWQKITNTQKPSIETWRTGTEYKKNEIVVYNEKIYKCAVDHTSGTDFSVDRPKYWESLSDNPIINDWISGNNYEIGTCVIKSNQNGIVDWTASKQYNVNDEVIYNDYIYTCKTQNTDAEFTEANWEVKEPVYNRIYRCIKNTNSKNFNESEWQLINGDSKATVDEVYELLA